MKKTIVSFAVILIVLAPGAAATPMGFNAGDVTPQWLQDRTDETGKHERQYGNSRE